MTITAEEFRRMSLEWFAPLPFGWESLASYVTRVGLPRGRAAVGDALRALERDVPGARFYRVTSCAGAAVNVHELADRGLVAKDGVDEVIFAPLVVRA